MVEKDYAPPSTALKLLHRAWPIVALAIALAVNLAWIGLLAHAVVKLL